jgi:hypothetical protein
MLLSQTSLEGRVLTNANGAYLERGSDRIAAAPGTVVQPGDRLTTRGGTTTLRWGDNTIVYCGPQTMLSMAQESKLLLEAGEVRVVRRGPDGLQVRAKDVEVNVRKGVGRVHIDGTDVRVKSERGDVTAQRLAQSGQRRVATPNRRFVSHLQQQANTLAAGTTRTFTANGGESTEDTEAGWDLDPESVVMEGAGSQNQSLLSSFASNLASSTPPTSAPTSQGTGASANQTNDSADPTNYQIGQQNLAALNASALATLGGALSSAAGTGSGTTQFISDLPRNDGILIERFTGFVDGNLVTLAERTEITATAASTFLQSHTEYDLGNASNLSASRTAFTTNDGLPENKQFWSIISFPGGHADLPSTIEVPGAQIRSGQATNLPFPIPVSIAGEMQSLKFTVNQQGDTIASLLTSDLPITAIAVAGQPGQYLIKWDSVNVDPSDSSSGIISTFSDNTIGVTQLDVPLSSIDVSKVSVSPYVASGDTALDNNATFAFGQFTVQYGSTDGELTFAVRQADIERISTPGGSESDPREVVLNENVDYVSSPSGDSSGGKRLFGEALRSQASLRRLDRTQKAAFTTLMAETLHDFAARTGQTRFVVDGKIIDISGYRKQLPR